MPGFLASRIVSAIAVRRPQGLGGTVIEALIISYLIYLALDVLGCGAIVRDPAGKEIPRVAFDRAWLSLVPAVVFAILYGASINHDWHMGLLQWVRASPRTARAGTWLDVFMKPPGAVVVNYVDGRRVMGWLDHYSDDPKEGLLYLRDPAWESGGEWRRVGEFGMLIDVRNGVESVTFLTGEAEDA